MTKKECNIVRDLLPNLIENLITDDSKQFVENHINNCSECKDILETLQSDKLKQNIDSNENEQIEINHLKKYKKKMSLVKTLLFSLISIITIILIVLCICLVKSIRIYNIKRTAYEKAKELEISNNVSIQEVYHTVSYVNNMNSYCFSTSSYKDGKLKLSRKSIVNNVIDRDYSYYTEIGSNKRIEIDNMSKTLTNATYNYTFDNPSQIGLTTNANIDTSYHVNLFIGVCFNWFTDIKTNTYNNIECYVLRDGNSDEYTEVWIDKNSMIPIRTIVKFEKQYTEIIYSVYTNNLSDKDFEIPNTDSYTIKDIEYNASEDVLKAFEEMY